MAALKSDSLFLLICEFLTVYLPIQRNSSLHTVKAYRTSLEQLLDYTKRQCNRSLADVAFDTLTAGMISGFLDNLETEVGCSVSTRNHRLSVFGRFSATRL